MITSKNFNHNLKGLNHFLNTKTESTKAMYCIVHEALQGTSISKNWLAKTSSAKERI